jgi:hypothetical protein
MNVVGLFVSVERQIDEAVDSLGPIIDVVGGRPIVDGPCLVGTHDE